MSRKHKKIYIKHFNRIIKILRKEKILSQENIKAEVAAACFTAAFLAMAYAGQNYIAIAPDLEDFIYKKIRSSLPRKQENYFKKRCDFYNSVLGEKSIYAIALLCNPPEDINSKLPLKLTLAILDCLLCPECIVDYENAALPIFDIFKLSVLPKRVITPVANEFIFLITEITNINK